MKPGDRWAVAYAVPGLDGYEAAVLLALAYHADSDSLEAWPSLELLSAETRFSPDTCRRAVRRLIAKGVIEARISAGRTSNRYRLTALQPSLIARVEPSPVATVADSNPSYQQPQPLLLASQPSLLATRTGKNRELTGRGARTASAVRRSRVPDSLPLTEAMIAWGAAQGMSKPALEDETAKFLDYWRGKGELRADWQATWRNWIRNAVKFGSRRINGARTPASRPLPMYRKEEDAP